MTPERYDPRHQEPTEPMFGYRGPFPTTPCRTCGYEYFRWVGDWGMGYWCIECRSIWKPL